VRERVLAGHYVLPGRVKRHMRARGWDEGFVRECAIALGTESFHKSMTHHARPGVRLDVYRPWVRGTRIYMKVTLYESEDDVLVLSLCVDGTAH
jgi:hypothetical protein